MSNSVIGGLHSTLHEFVHTHAPHTSAEFYLLSLIGALLFAGAGMALALVRSRTRSGSGGLGDGALGSGNVGNGGVGTGFNISNLSSGSSFVIYVLMPFVPFDEDLLAPLAQSWFTVALAGIIGAGIMVRSLWRHPGPANATGLHMLHTARSEALHFSPDARSAENRVPLSG